MAAELSVFLAFGAGLLSFLSPCVLPLIPSFLSLIGGVSLRAGEEKPSYPGGGIKPPETEPPANSAGGMESPGRKNAGGGVVTGTLCFILGFSCVFALLGILFSGPALLLGGMGRAIDIAAGIIVVILGLNILFNFLRFLNYEKRFHITQKRRGLAGSFLAGAAFGAGWSPCVGPILGGILLLAGQSGELGRAVLYLAAYSVGLGLPFLLSAVFLDAFVKRLRKLNAWLPAIQRLSGIFLIFIGVFIMTGRFKTLSALFQRGGYILADWARENGPAARFLPAAIFLLAALLPPALYALKRKTLPPRLLLAPCAGLLLLGCAQAAGFINIAGLIADWFLFQGG